MVDLAARVTRTLGRCRAVGRARACRCVDDCHTGVFLGRDLARLSGVHWPADAIGGWILARPHTSKVVPMECCVGEIVGGQTSSHSYVRRTGWKRSPKKRGALQAKR